KEVAKKNQHDIIRGTASPKVYIRVKDGKVVEVVSNQTGIQSVPDVSGHGRSCTIGYPQPISTHERYEIRYGGGRGDDGIESEEIVHRIVETRRNDDVSRLNRTSSVPAF